jgi:hypothetical protein
MVKEEAAFDETVRAKVFVDGPKARGVPAWFLRRRFRAPPGADEAGG